MNALIQDLRFGLRMLAKNPGFTTVAVITLALGIGATTAVFSVADRILFRSLPYPDPDRLVSVGLVAPIEPNEFMLGADYLEWRERQTSLESFTSMQPGITDCDLTEQNPVRLNCARVESNFLPTFGVHPLLGRNFTREEDRPNAPRVALLSYGLWRSRFGGESAAVGKTFPLDGQEVRIVGVLPRDFEFPTLAHVDTLLPLALDEAAQRRDRPLQVLRAFGRLKAGVSPAQAQAALTPLFDESLKFVPPQFRKEVRLSVRSLRERQVADVRLASWILLFSVFAVLLIACANVAGLLLARGVSRQRELSVRAALGAGRWRLIRQSLTESALLGVTGGGIGCLLAVWLLKAFVTVAPQGIPRLDQAALDLRALIFAAGVSLGCALLSGMVPAMATPRAELLAGRHTVGVAKHGFRQALVAMQVAVSLILLAGASLLLRTLWNLQYQPLGFQAQGVVISNIALGLQQYSQPAQQMAFYDALEARVRQLPDVTAVAVSDSLPPGGRMRFMIFASILVEGRPRFAEGTGGMVAWRGVTPGYFAALGIPILRGRDFEEADRDPGKHALILSQLLARRLFPDEDPLGKRLQLGLTGPWFTVMGVAGNVKNGGLSEPGDPEYYVVRRRTPEDATRHASLIVRSSLDPAAVASWVRTEITGLDPTLPVEIETMNQRIRVFTARPRFNAALLGLFAGLGLLLAAVGIYGVTAFLVTQRVQEIGIRMALGAERRNVLGLIVRHGLRLTLFGVVLGVAGAWALTSFLASFLFGVAPRDPATFVLVSLALVAVSILACYIPARRATKVDPMVALRYE
jgi:putative ABC transport system permease protein